MIVPVNIVAVQVNANNSLFVTIGVDYDNSGSIVGSEITAQYTLYPGDSLEGQPTEVVKIANALWTQEMIDAALAKKAAEKAAQEAAAKAAAEESMIVPPVPPPVQSEPVLVANDAPVADASAA